MSSFEDSFIPVSVQHGFYSCVWNISFMYKKNWQRNVYFLQYDTGVIIDKNVLSVSLKKVFVK